MSVAVPFNGSVHNVAQLFAFTLAMAVVFLLVSCCRTPTSFPLPSPVIGVIIRCLKKSISNDTAEDHERNCDLLSEMNFYVERVNHTLSEALSSHPAAVQSSAEACVHIVFARGRKLINKPKKRRNDTRYVVINVNPRETYRGSGEEIIVQSMISRSAQSSFIVDPNVESFDILRWVDRGQILPLGKRRIAVILDMNVIGNQSNLPDGAFPRLNCTGNCESSISAHYCLLFASPFFTPRLLSALRANCIPVIMDEQHPLPFDDLLDWSLASLRLPRSLIEAPKRIRELLYIEKEHILEMRRMGALADSLVAAIAHRLHFIMPRPPTLTPCTILLNGTSVMFYPSTEFIPEHHYLHKRIRSKEVTNPLILRKYTKERWNAGKDARYSPRTLANTPSLPAESEDFPGTMERIESARGVTRLDGSHLGLDRDEEQFTVVILTRERDEAVADTISVLDNCPYLNKVIVIWNNDYDPYNTTFPKIHVPVLIIVPEKNSLHSRFLPYAEIETEAILSLDDDIAISKKEVLHGFRAWRENRDRIVGFFERYHARYFNQTEYTYVFACQYSMTLTGGAFLHKEYLFEYQRQHPFILEHIDRVMNCEDIAMNFLVAHLTRKSPVKLPKLVDSVNPRAQMGLTANGNHLSERGECLRLFTRIYGYNPLLSSQMMASTTSEFCYADF